MSAEIHLDKIPLLPKVQDYLEQGCIPGGTHRNWAIYGEKVKLRSDADKFILCDPQTSGGLMIAVVPSAIEEVKAVLAKADIYAEPFGELVKRGKDLIVVE